MDPPPGRQTLAKAASAHLFQRCGWSRAFYLAGKSRSAASANLRRSAGCAARLSHIPLDQSSPEFPSGCSSASYSYVSSRAYLNSRMIFLPRLFTLRNKKIVKKSQKKRRFQLTLSQNCILILSRNLISTPRDLLIKPALGV